VLAADQKDFAKSQGIQLLRPVFGDGLLTSDGELHARQRRLAQPLFHRELITGWADAMAELADEHQRGWRQGDALDLHYGMRVLTVRVLGRVMFGTDFGSDAERVTEAINGALSLARRALIPGPRFARLLPITGEVAHAKRTLDEIVDRLMHERLSSANGDGD